MELKSKGQDLKLGDKFIPYVEEGELWITWDDFRC